MGKKSKHQRREQLQVQQQEDDRAAASAQNPGTNLHDLPVEILEAICLEVVVNRKYGYSRNVREMSPLRLTRREIRDKLHDYFAKLAFGHWDLCNTYRSHKRLLYFVQESALAEHIRSLCLYPKEEWSALECDRFRDALAAGQLSGQERRRTEDWLRSNSHAQSQNSFFETSTSDGIMLLQAMKYLTGLRDIYIIETPTVDMLAPARKSHGSPLPSTTHFFSMLLACFSFSGIRPRPIKTLLAWSQPMDSGVDIQALCAPKQVLSSLGELRSLVIRLHTKSTEVYKNPDSWTRHLADFLKHTPKLTNLEVGIGDDLDGTQEVFSNFATQTHLPNLKKLRLDGFECRASDLATLLQKHDTLKALKLANLNIIDSTAAEALTSCAEHVNNLESLRIKQISQDAQRTLFGTLGKVKCYMNFSEEESDDDESGEAEAEESAEEGSARAGKGGGGELSGSEEWDDDCVVVYLPLRHTARRRSMGGSGR